MMRVDTIKLTEFCQRWKIAEVALFGSATGDDFNEKSDVDVLVSFFPDARPSLLTMVDMEEELEQIFRRPVDLVTRRAVEQSINPYRKRAILDSAEVIYGAP
jgi:predicted nucleotidyltransferase